MAKRILITGGAGFIGSEVADELLLYGHRVRVLDNLAAQVHGGSLPEYLDDAAQSVAHWDFTDARGAPLRPVATPEKQNAVA